MPSFSIVRIAMETYSRHSKSIVTSIITDYFPLVWNFSRKVIKISLLMHQEALYRSKYCSPPLAARKCRYPFRPKKSKFLTRAPRFSDVGLQVATFSELSHLVGFPSHVQKIKGIPPNSYGAHISVIFHSRDSVCSGDNSYLWLNGCGWLSLYFDESSVLSKSHIKHR